MNIEYGELTSPADGNQEALLRLSCADRGVRASANRGTGFSHWRGLVVATILTLGFGCWPTLASAAWLLSVYGYSNGVQYEYPLQVDSFPTKQAAEQALAALPFPTGVPGISSVYGTPGPLKDMGVFKLISGNGTVTHIYSAPDVQPTPILWGQFSWGGDLAVASYASEADAVAAQTYGPCNVDTGQGESSATPAGPWIINGTVAYNGSYESRAYTQNTTLVVTTTSPATCVAQTPISESLIALQQGGKCPTGYLSLFNSDSQSFSCENGYGALLTGPMKDCPDNGTPTAAVGDPCDVSTGDLSLTEADYTSAGVPFVRYYHSATLGTTHVLGVGWTHNYAGYLVIFDGVPNGLVRPDGNQDAVQYINGEYISTSGDGIHVLQSGTNWVAYKPDGSNEVYSSTGQLLELVAASGIATTLTYNAQGLLASVADPFGHVLQLSYNAADQISSVTEPDGASVITYAYDGNSNLISVTYADGSARQYQYQDTNFANNLTGVLDETGTQFLTVSYDPTTAFAVSSQQAGGAQAVSIAYGAGSGIVTDSLGAVSTYTFGGSPPRVTSLVKNGLAQTYTLPSYNDDPQQRVVQSTDANGNVTTYSYDTDHLTSKTEAFGTPVARTTSYQYLAPDSALLTLLSEPLRQTAYVYYPGTSLVQTKTISDPIIGTSRSWNYTYDGYGRVLAAQGPRTDVNSTATYTYYTCMTGAQCGELQTITDPVGNVTTYNTYNAHGQPLTITDSNGVVTTLTYDLRQRVLSRSTAGETTTFSYYATGLVQAVTLPDGSGLQFTYDGAHRATSVQDSLGNSTHYTLDAMGNRLAVSTYDPNSVLGTTQSRVFNALDELYQVIGSAGTAAVTTSYGYDNDGNQVSVNAPLSRSSSEVYDGLSRVSQMTDPNGGNTLLTHDANDRVTTVQDPTGLVTSFTYDGLGDLLQEVDPATGPTHNTYDSAGNLIASLDARGVTATYTYDAANRVTQGAYGDETIVFGYDAGKFGKGRLTSASDASQSLSWQYDALGRVVQKTEMVGNVTAVVGYAYVSGDMINITTPSGQNIAYGYTNHQITSISVNGTSLLSSVSYEPFGPARSWSWGNGASEIRAYDTDGNPNQFTGAESTSYTVDSAFRIAGIANSSNPSVSWTYGYDNLDRITSASTPNMVLSWTYDGDGNRLSQVGNTQNDGTAVLSYNNRGRLVNVSTNAGSVTMLYNGLGQRIEKSSSLGTVMFVYDENGHMLGEYDGYGDLIEETVWLGDLPVATLQPDGNGGVNAFYIHADHLDAPKSITRPSDNAIVWRWDQDPFGTLSPNQSPSGLGTFSYNPRFPGQYFDAETGMSQNVLRDYDPQVGRYIQSDPLGLRGGSFSTYTYVNSRPIAHADRFGLAPEPIEWPNANLNEKLQDIDTLIEFFWLPQAIKNMKVCTQAICHYMDCNGIKFDVTTNSWLPSAPTPAQVSEQTPECKCTNWDFRRED